MWLIVAQADPDMLPEARRLRRSAIHAVEMQAQVPVRESESRVELAAVKHQQPALAFAIGVDLHFHLVGVIAIHEP